MNKLFAFSIGCLASSISVAQMATVKIDNALDQQLADYPVSYSFNQLGIAPTNKLAVTYQGRQLPSQLVDDDQDGTYDRLMFLIDLKPLQKAEVQIDTAPAITQHKKRTRAEISVKREGQWQGQKYVGGQFNNVNRVDLPPQYTDHSEYIRYEGPGIESESVGYRIYLDWRNGFDIFGKTKSQLVLDTVGQDGYKSYHEMADWGADILKVGKSLGIGGYGYWNGEQVVKVSDVKSRSATITDDGDFYSAFNIDYQGWNYGEGTADLTARLSMTAGSPLVNVQLSADQELNAIATGIVDHGVQVLEGDLNIPGAAWSYIATYGEQTEFTGQLAMVILFQKQYYKQTAQDKHNHVVVMRTRGKQLQYYFGALWSEGPNAINSVGELEQWLADQVAVLTKPPRKHLTTAFTDQALPKALTAKTVKQFAVQAALSEQQRSGLRLAKGGYDEWNKRPAYWNYRLGLLMQSFAAVGDLANRPDISSVANQVIDSFVSDQGDIDGFKASNHNIDDINSGKMLLRLLKDTDKSKYRSAADKLATAMASHPRTSQGAFWHKKRYPHQLWLDGVYMGMPFLAEYGVMVNNRDLIKEAVHELQVTHQQLFDETTGLYFHAYDEAKAQPWADKETGLSSHVWGRGVGWYAMALVDMLAILDDNDPLRTPVLDIVDHLAKQLKQHQHGSGAWFQVLDQPNGPGNYLEASASSMFVYFLATAVEQGYIDSSYLDVAKKGYQGLLDQFVTVNYDQSIDVNGICKVAGLSDDRNGSYDYYMSEAIVTNDPKGFGPFLLASVAVSKMLDKSTVANVAFKKTKLLYQNDFSTVSKITRETSLFKYGERVALPDASSEWIAEGWGGAKICQGKLWVAPYALKECNQIAEKQQKPSNMVLWSAQVYPDNFLLEFSVNHHGSDNGLTLVFLSATGMQGESIFDLEQPMRDANYKKYTGSLSNYTVSYWSRNQHAKAIKNKERYSNRIRRNPGMQMLASADSHTSECNTCDYQVSILKLADQIVVHINGQLVNHAVDTRAPLGIGRIGLRSMRGITKVSYDDFSVYAVEKV